MKYSKNYMLLLAAINEEIKNRKLKQVKLAGMVGIKNSSTCSFLPGGRTIPSDKLIDLLNVLEIKLMKKIEKVIMSIEHKDFIQNNERD
jgi:predicted XRE-type DNA-binding protein